MTENRGVYSSRYVCVRVPSSQLIRGYVDTCYCIEGRIAYLCVPPSANLSAIALICACVKFCAKAPIVHDAKANSDNRAMENIRDTISCLRATWRYKRMILGWVATDQISCFLSFGSSMQ